MSASTTRTPRTRFLTTLGAAVLGAAVLVTGTGVSSQAATQNVSVAQVAAPAAETAQLQAAAAKSPVAIYKAARKKAKKAKSVRVQATFEDAGGDVKLDLRMTKAGKATGTISTPGEGSMKVILTSKKTGYFKPGKKMLDQIAAGDESVRQLLAGRWLVFHRGDGLDELFELGAMPTYTQDIFSLSGPQSGLRKVKGAKVKGYKKTIGLKEKGYQGTLLIANDGTNRLAGYRDPESRVTHTAWNKKVTVKAPKNPLDLNNLS